MSDLVVIAFDDQQTGLAFRAKLVELQKEYLIDMDDAVVVTKDEDGKVKLHQSVSLTAAGAAGGAFWGLLIGAIFFIPLFGTLIGAASGALGGYLSDAGIDDKMMKQMAENLKPGGSEVFVLVRKSTPDKLLNDLSEFKGKGTVIKTSLNADEEASLRKVLEKAHTTTKKTAQPA